MLLTEHKNKLTTNVNNETLNFGIGDASVVIDILRNRLYEHKIRTLVQEYISNARDSMRELGNFENNFEITVPNRLNPVFKVRDFGPGITPDRMANVFVLYGSSTKRTSNVQTGGFGIGAKSAWSYTDSFSIVTFVDGTKRSYVAHIGVNNNGRLDFVSEELTDLPNGTEISVPVKHSDINEFEESIKRAIYFWEKRPKLLGELNILPKPNLLKINDNLSFTSHGTLPIYLNKELKGYSSYYGDSMFVIDGIPYTFSESLDKKIGNFEEFNELNKSIAIFFINNGVVEVSASRESIADSKFTIENLQKFAHKVTKDLLDFVHTEFKAVTSVREYLDKYKLYNKHFRIENYATYQGYSIKNEQILHADLANVTVTKLTQTGRWGKKTEKVHSETFSKCLYLDKLENTFYLTDDKETTIIRNKRAREYLKKHQSMYVVEAKPGFKLDQIISDFELLNLQTITFTEEPKQSRNKIVRGKEELCLHYLNGDTRDTQYVQSDTITDDHLYIEMSDNSFGSRFSNKYELGQLSAWLNNEYKLKLCGVSGKTLKCVATHHNFNSFDKWLSKYKATKDQVKSLKHNLRDNSDVIGILKKFDISKIKDPFLIKMIGIYKENEINVCSLPEMIKKLVKLYPEVVQFEKDDEQLSFVIDNSYILLKDWYDNDKNTKELIYYINAKFEVKDV